MCKDSLLLDDNDPAVLAELARIEALRADVSSHTGDSAAKSKSWVKLHMNVAELRSIAA